jgi:hypothetical protein
MMLETEDEFEAKSSPVVAVVLRFVLSLSLFKFERWHRLFLVPCLSWKALSFALWFPLAHSFLAPCFAINRELQYLLASSPCARTLHTIVRTEIPIFIVFAVICCIGTKLVPIQQMKANMMMMESSHPTPRWSLPRLLAVSMNAAR